jgi:hypothetical protein
VIDVGRESLAKAFDEGRLLEDEVGHDVEGTATEDVRTVTKTRR